MSRATDLDTADVFAAADLTAPADLFVTRRAGSGRSGLSCRRFDTAMEAIAFALDNFASRGPNDVVMAVDDKRFNLAALRAISRSGPHPASASGSEQTQ
jgi:hypothetical protein